MTTPARCIGSRLFGPDETIQDAERLKRTNELLAVDNLYEAICVYFQLPEKDTYTYHAMSSVTLEQVQRVVKMGDVNELHTWYRDEAGSARQLPTRSDVDAYISIFLSTTATLPTLKNYGNNAKKGSLRSEVAPWLLSRRYIDPSRSTTLAIPKCKSPPSLNPYFDFWAWSCRSLEWCGPCGASEKSQSHHVLPVFMHHFGCAVPSHEALETLRILARGREVADVGSGNGYWTLMLRRYGLTVHPVDNMQSEWRVLWAGDTAVTDGVKWLGRRAGGKDMVLLLVYPVVGTGTPGMELTRKLLGAFKGDTIAVVGTQNSSGYTSFKDMRMDEYMEREQKGWRKVVQIALPSFAGLDEALYVFERLPRT